jgi:hypothetical protein
MADTRINALSTATVSLSDDFLPIDGTTAGTRKLSAYSPTFGGNATVGGTLTVNGGGVFTRANTGALAIKSGDAGSYTDISLGRTAAEHFLAIAGSANNYVAGTVAGDCALNASSATAAIFVGVYGNAIGKFTSSGLSIPTTTASTSTSSGALVVGNGTSGGLGVGGNIYGGGNIVSTAAGGRFLIFGTGNTTESKELTFKRSDDADNFTLGLTGSAYAGSLSGLGNNEAYLYNSSASAFRIFIGTAATNRFDFTQSQFKINATTASTSTSSGALVVSGGVGVAGAITAGGTLRVVGSSQIIRVRHDASNIEFTNTAQDAYVTGTVIGNTLQLHGNNGTGLTIGTTGNATFAGNITTGAPSGGTAAAWKLGTVATVSPTSPNRTIEVDIGGTIYYIHAKTTNN